MMDLPRLIFEIEERKKDGRSIADLADDILRELKAWQAAPSAVQGFGHMARMWEHHPAFLASTVRDLRLSPAALEGFIDVVRKGAVETTRKD